MNQLQFSPGQLAKAIGVSESSLKRWVDEGRIAATRTAGGHRRIARDEAIRFLRERGIQPTRPDLLGLPDRATDRRPLEELLYDALERGELAHARAHVLGAWMDGQSVAELCDGPIRLALRKLGELWNHREGGIYLEHRATEECVSLLHQLRGLVGTKPEAPLAMGCAAGGDPYVLPSLMASTVLGEAGFRTLNLGADCPLDSLWLAAREQRPRLVWLSVSITRRPKAMVEELEDLHRRLSEMGVDLMIGGRAIDHGPLAKSSTLCVGRSMTELAGFAKANLRAMRGD